VSANQAIYGIATMCRVLAVSASGYYAWRQRPPSDRARAGAALTARICTIHQYSRATHGAPRIHQELRVADIHIGRKRVARLMNAACLAGVSRRKWMITTMRDQNAGPAPDLVERNFVAPAPDCLWVADVTYIPTWADPGGEHFRAAHDRHMRNLTTRFNQQMRQPMPARRAV
jgi:putative transposase